MDVGDPAPVKTAWSQTLRRRFQDGVCGQTCGRKGARRVPPRPRATAKQKQSGPFSGLSADDDDTPSCGQCSGPVQLVRTIPRMGAHPGLVRLPLHALQSRGNQTTAKPGRAVLNAKCARAAPCEVANAEKPMLPRAARLHLQTDVQTEQLANPMTPRREAFHWLDRLAARAAGVGSRC